MTSSASERDMQHLHRVAVQDARNQFVVGAVGAVVFAACSIALGVTRQRTFLIVATLFVIAAIVQVRRLAWLRAATPAQAYPRLQGKPRYRITWLILHIAVLVGLTLATLWWDRG
jgi:hypothetical protein